ncbi:MAG: glycosyltransferase family 4 protein [Gemmatimonadetes bacterium]|nr:glycosyltransferase family 4 protein [Gemmatimonadota bacterium]
MRVGLLVRNLDEPGGIGVYTRELLMHLFAQDHETEYFVFLGGQGSRGRFAEHANVHEVVLPCRGKLWWDQVQVARHANRLELDAVFCPKMSLPFRFRGRKLLTMHGAEQFVFPEEFSLVDRIYVRFFLPLYARAADRVITVSETARHDLAPILGVPESRFSVITHGPKEIYAEPVSQQKIAEMRQKYGLEGDFILHVGLVWGAKNFEIFPEVLEIVNRERPLLLAHAGKPHRWRDEQATRRADPYVRELGLVPDEDLAALYHSAVALVFPSLYEGFGIPLVEAMAAGCPVVTSDWGAMKEVTGDAAVHVDSRRPEALAEAVLDLLRHPERREELAARGRVRARDFSWDDAARRTLAVFREVAT